MRQPETHTDEQLLEHVRHGTTHHFGTLWERHRRAGLVAARNIAPSLDAEEIVAEAYLKIFELVRDGRGPKDAFRPYLYTVIKTVAVDLLRSPEHATAELDGIESTQQAQPWDDQHFNVHAATTAYQTLSPRWQEALWYTEVEQLPPRQVAPLLGCSANNVSTLTRRAREAFKSAFVEQHLRGGCVDDTCRRHMHRLQRHQLGKLPAKKHRETSQHLRECVTCAKAAAELRVVNRRLGLLLGGVLLGGSGTVGLFGQCGGVFTGVPLAAAAANVGGNGVAAGSGVAVPVAAGGVVSGGVAVSGVSVVALAAAAAVVGGASLVVSGVALPVTQAVAVVPGVDGPVVVVSVEPGDAGVDAGAGETLPVPPEPEGLLEDTMPPEPEPEPDLGVLPGIKSGGLVLPAPGVLPAPVETFPAAVFPDVGVSMVELLPAQLPDVAPEPEPAPVPEPEPWAELLL